MGLLGGKKKTSRKPNQKKSTRKKTSVPKYPVRVVSKLPKNPEKRVIYEKVVRGKNGRRRVGFVYTGKQGFGKWKIVYNRSA